MNIKKLALLCFSISSTTSVVAVASFSNASSILTLAQECDHVGNHYTKLEQTPTSSGTKEYWVCCKCHQHFLTQPVPKTSYIWTDAGIASTINDENDDRYIAPGHNVNSLSNLGFNVNDMGDGTFWVLSLNNNISLDVVIPDCVTYISGTAFSNSDKGRSITSLVLSNNLGRIDANSFKGCDNIKTVVIPTSVESIGSNAFESCVSLESVYIPTTVLCVNSNAFYGDTNLVAYLEDTSQPEFWVDGWNNTIKDTVWGGYTR